MAWAAPALAAMALFGGLLGFLRLPPRPALGALLLGFAVALATFRMFALALPVAMVALPLLSTARSNPIDPDPQAQSTVRTDALEMLLDHDTGEMDGTVLDGPQSGARLSQLGSAELDALEDWLSARSDTDSLALLAAFRDRRGESQGDSTGNHSEQTQEHGPMSEAEAYRILGLKPGADLGEVRSAHRRLIRKMHPDQGGSSALAAMINAAKERLDPG